MVLPGGDVAVGTGTSPVLLGEVRPEGRGPMAAAAWARGVRIAKGETLGAIGAMPVSGGTS
jgi:methionyl-tRNA formyltransferase